MGSPQSIISFAQFLVDKNFYEEAFQVYERGLELFRNYYSTGIWQSYLLQFINKYRSTKKERTRELFEQAIVSIPKEGREMIYRLYASFEEKFGTLEKSLSIYKRAVRKIPQEARLSMYEIFII